MCRHPVQDSMLGTGTWEIPGTRVSSPGTSEQVPIPFYGKIAPVLWDHCTLRMLTTAALVSAEAVGPVFR